MALHIVGQVNLTKVAAKTAEREARKANAVVADTKAKASSKHAKAVAALNRKIKVTQTEVYQFVRSLDALHRRQRKRMLSKSDVLTLAYATIRERKLAQAALAKGISL